MAAPPTLRDVGRTLYALGTDVARYVAELALSPPSAIPSTTTAEGLAAIKASFEHTLRRAGVTLEVLHAERVPREGGVVLMWKQESHLDHLLLPVAIPRPFFLLYNNEIAKLPFYGAQMRVAGHVHVDRTDEAQWRPAVARAAERARKGECVLVSPEGTRSRDGKLLPLKRGAFLLAIASGRPVVCVTVVGAHERMPRGSPFVRAGRIRVVFSEPIATEGHDEANLGPLQTIVAETFEEAKTTFGQF
jgi:1-acyl-sn-glycerol-3-phosphate acyltransferase